jgi:hypothetical protein
MPALRLAMSPLQPIPSIIILELHIGQGNTDSSNENDTDVGFHPYHEFVQSVPFYHVGIHHISGTYEVKVKTKQGKDVLLRLIINLAVHRRIRTRLSPKTEDGLGVLLSVSEMMMNATRPIRPKTRS